MKQQYACPELDGPVAPFMVALGGSVHVATFFPPDLSHLPRPSTWGQSVMHHFLNTPHAELGTYTYDNKHKHRDLCREVKATLAGPRHRAFLIYI